MLKAAFGICKSPLPALSNFASYEVRYVRTDGGETYEYVVVETLPGPQANRAFGLLILH